MNQNDEQRVVSKDFFKTNYDAHDEKKYDVAKDERIIDTKRKSEPEPVKPSFYQKFLTKEGAMGVSGFLVLLCVAAYFIFSGSPKPVVEEYIKAIAAADFGKAYQCLAVKEHPTLGMPSYLKYIEFIRNSKGDNIYKLSQHELKSVDLVEGTEKNGVLSFEASIVVNKNNSEEVHKLTLSVEKKKTGPFGLFTGYKIAGTDVYAVPKINCLTGTEQVVIDGDKLAGEKEKLNLNKPVFYGWHEVECQGKFYDAFKDRANFDKESGMLKLDGKKFKLNSACLEAVTNASKEFTASFFPAALTDNGYKQCKTVPEEKSIEDMYKSCSEGFKQVGVSSIRITDGKLLSCFAGENGNIHCQYQYAGVYNPKGQAERPCNGMIGFEYVMEDGQLLVAKINDYMIHLKD